MYFSGPWENVFKLWQHFNILSFLFNLNLSNLTFPNQSTIPFPNPAGNSLSRSLSKLIYAILEQEMPDDLLKSHQNLAKLN